MTPATLLRCHFFAGFFRSEMLSEAGIDNYKTWLISVGAAFPAFHAQFARLRARNHGTDADELFVIAASFVTLLLAASLEWQALFPSGRDCQILSPLPVRRTAIFGARLGALGMFLGLVLVAGNVVPILTYPTAGHAATAILAGIHAALLAMALQGLCLLCLPRSFGFLIQAALLLTSVLALPLLLHLPGLEPLVRGRPLWLEWLPPVWWLGASERLRGSADPWHLLMAERAWTSLGVCAALTCACYLLLYRRFGEAVTPPADRCARASWLLQFGRIGDRGTFQFLTTVLARSPQHRLLLVGIAGAGLAIALEGVLLAVLRSRASAAAAMALPLLLGMGLLTSLTTVYRLPAEWAAHWVFRASEDPSARARQLESAVYALHLYAAASGVVIAFPLLIVTETWPVAPLAFGLLACLAEYRMMEWRRVPFTSTYSPSTWPVAMTIVIFLAQLLAFATFGGGLLQAANTGARPYLLTAAPLLGVWALLRSKRRSNWGAEPLSFSDDGNPDVLVTGFAPE